MLSEQTRAAYRRARADGYRPDAALSIARRGHPFDWHEPKRHAGTLVKYTSFERDGFQVQVEVHLDPDHDFGFMRGKFVWAWEPDAIRNPHVSLDSDHEPRYFVPEDSYENRRHGYAKIGYARHLADVQARMDVQEDLEIVRDPEKQGCEAYGIIVTVSYNGVELATESSSDIELINGGYDDPYLNSVANELTQEALQRVLDEAKTTLQTLRD